MQGVPPFILACSHIFCELWQLCALTALFNCLRLEVPAPPLLGLSSFLAAGTCSGGRGMCRINVTERKASHVLTKTLKIPFLSFLQYCYSYILHGIWVYYRLRRKEWISWLIAGQKVGILISPRAKDGVCPQSKRQSVRQSIRGGGPGNPPYAYAAVALKIKRESWLRQAL